MEVRLCDFGLAIENGGDGEQTILELQIILLLKF